MIDVQDLTKRYGHLELAVTRIGQGHPAGVIAEHRRQSAIPAAHVHGMAEPAALQQPGQGHHFGAVLMAARRPVVQVVDIRLVILAENGSGPLAWRDDAHLSPISPSSRFAATKESGPGILLRAAGVMPSAVADTRLVSRQTRDSASGDVSL
jgi:hypothetical protein